jgi:hypothetical protein
MSVLNMGQDMNELQETITENTGLVEQCFETNNLSMNSIKTRYCLFQMKQCWQEIELKIVIQNTSKYFV